MSGGGECRCDIGIGVLAVGHSGHNMAHRWICEGLSGWSPGASWIVIKCIDTVDTWQWINTVLAANVGIGGVVI